MRRLTQAAQAGDANAQYNLAVLYDNRTDDNGYAITGNRGEAIRWLLAAARQGLPRAQFKLAEMHVDGPDSDGSHADACFWLLVAESNLAGAQREKAQAGYARLAAGLSPAKIAEVIKRVRLWKQAEPAGNAAWAPPEAGRKAPANKNGIPDRSDAGEKLSAATAGRRNRRARLSPARRSRRFRSRG